MKEVIIKVKEGRCRLFLQFLKTLDYVTVVQSSSNKKTAQSNPVQYDFSDLIGKLGWKGDAVGQQRLLRDEW